MNEWLQILMLCSGGVLFAAGGTHIPKWGGQKWLRRFILPLVIGVICYFSGLALWRLVGMCIGLCIAFHLGYGSRTPYWMKAITAAMFTLPTLFIGFSWFQLLTPICFLSMFYLSNTPYWGKYFTWKIVEFLVGVFICATIVQLVNQTY